jgi:hypothetical protein
MWAQAYKDLRDQPVLKDHKAHKDQRANKAQKVNAENKDHQDLQDQAMSVLEHQLVTLLGFYRSTVLVGT